MRHGFVGIAVTGLKYSGKDAAINYLAATRSSIVIRCKTPIVSAFERYNKKRYDKVRDDAAMMVYSKEVLRKNDPLIVVKYLQERVEFEKANPNPTIILIPDARFKDENDWCYGNHFLCIKVNAALETRMERAIMRDGTTDNWKPDDPSERDIDRLRNQYEVENNGMLPGLYQQLELVVNQYAPRQPYGAGLIESAKARIITTDDPSHPFFSRVEVIEYDSKNTEQLIRYGPKGIMRGYPTNDLLLEAFMPKEGREHIAASADSA